MLYIGHMTYKGKNGLSDQKRLGWSEDRRAMMREVHRRRHGAPNGYCTIYGTHVPSEHHDPVRYWAGWLANRHGRAAAVEFVKDHAANNWSEISRVRELWDIKKLVSANRQTIRRVEQEIENANKNRR